MTWIVDDLETRSADELDRISIDEFLSSTSRFDVDAAERLRLLALEVEARHRSTRPRRAWTAVKRIYDRALQYAPNDALILESIGVAATEIATSADRVREHGLRDELLHNARQTLRHAADLAPNDADVAYSLALAIYFDRNSHKREALEAFDRALTLGAEHAWACLYRAHCLHDLERWHEAVTAYAAVPNDAFRGGESWLLGRITELRAECRLRAGDRAGALADFLTAIQRYEAHAAYSILSPREYHHHAAETCFPELAPKLAALEARLDHEI